MSFKELHNWGAIHLPCWYSGIQVHSVVHIASVIAACQAGCPYHQDEFQRTVRDWGAIPLPLLALRHSSAFRSPHSKWWIHVIAACGNEHKHWWEMTRGWEKALGEIPSENQSVALAKPPGPLGRHKTDVFIGAIPACRNLYKCYELVIFRSSRLLWTLS